MRSKRNKKADEKRRRKIRAVMVRKGIVGAEIARRLEVSRQHVTNVIAGRFSSKRVEAELVGAGVPAEYFREAEHGQVGMQNVQNG